MFRILLFALIIFLIVKMFLPTFRTSKQTDNKKNDIKMTGEKKKKHISKDVGEYVDYEEMDGNE